MRSWNVHDLRRTVAIGFRCTARAHESNLEPRQRSHGGIAGVYQRHDWASEKRAALDAWAAHVVSLTKHRPAKENVIKLTGGRNCPSGLYRGTMNMQRTTEADCRQEELRQNPRPRFL